MEVIFENYLFLATTVVAYMSFWFLLSVFLKRNDIADIAWGLGFLLIAALSFYRYDFGLDRGLLVTVLVFLWSTRLSFHIYSRNKGKREDYRYKKWRDEWGKLFYIRSFLQVFLLQGLLMLVISAPVIIINTYRGGPLNLIDFIGFFIWTTGFLFETIGDYQLNKFIKNPLNKGKVMKYGLWKYSRHPNYFGEVMQWWGIWIIALSVSYGFFSIVGPLVITTLILKISGIPMLEKKMEENEEFQEYKKKTSVFFPLPPKNS